MHISLIIALLDARLYLALLIPFTLLSLPLFRSITFSFYDPFWITALSINFTFALMLYAYLVDERLSSGAMFYMLGTLAAFFAGAIVVRYALRRPAGPQVRAAASPIYIHHADEARFISVFLLVACLILLITFVARAVFVGLPILAPDPEAAKVMVNQRGFGLLTRIADPLVNVSLLLLFYVRRVSGRFPRGAWLYFTVILMLLLSNGSKSALIPLYTAFFFANAYVSLRKREPFRFISLPIALLGAAGVLLYAVVVLFLRGSGTREEDVAAFVLQTLTLRFLVSGDGPYYYFTNNLDLYMSQSIGAYLWDYLVIPLLAPFRLVAYEPSVGLQITKTLFGTDLFGPNPTMYVEGDIYFGRLGGVLYGGALGAICALCKFLPAKIAVRRHVPILIVFYLGNIVAMKVSQDMLLFSADIINYALIILPTALLTMVMIRLAQAIAPRPILAEPSSELRL